MNSAAARTSPGLPSLGPIAALVIGAAMTFAVWRYADEAAERARRQAFDDRVQHALLALDRVVDELSGLLQTVRSVAEQSRDLSEAAFQRAIASRSQRLFATGLQYVAVLEPRSSPDCVDGSSTPCHGLVVQYVYPHATNEAIVGRDFSRLPGRAEPTTRAIDYGYIALSQPLDEAVDSAAVRGLQVFLPVYSRLEDIGTVRERRASIRALGMAAFSVEDLLRAELGGSFFESTGLRIRDLGVLGSGATGTSPSRLVVDGTQLVRAGLPAAGDDAAAATPARTVTRAIAGRNWRVEFWSRAPAAARWTPTLPMQLLVMGSLATASAALYLQALASGRRRAERRAARMTESLRLREDQLRQALETARMGSWQWTAGEYCCDSRASGLLRLTHGPLEALQDIVDEADRPAMREALARARGRDAPFFIECRLTRPGEPTRWIELTGQVIAGSDGRPARAQGLVRDVTQRAEHADERRRLMRRLVAAEENARARIGRELHDQLGQEITTLSLGLRNLEATGDEARRARLLVRLQTIVEQIDRRVDEVMLDLRPVALDDLGLEAALHALFEQWSAVQGIEVVSHLNGIAGTALPTETATTAFRIVQEALTNVARHSGARRVDVIVERAAGTIRLVVEDDGRGDSGTRNAGSQGLEGMRERVALIGGEFSTESTPGNGFSVFARLPVTTQPSSVGAA